MKVLSIIVPVYYNEESLSDLFDKISILESKLLEQDIEVQKIFVDDGSQDKSWDILCDFKKKSNHTVKLIKLSRNFGAYNAVKAGLDFVTGDCFCFLSADLQDPPELIVTMISNWLSGKKFIICERESREDSFSTKIFARFYYKILKLLAIPYPNGGYDLALMDKIMLPYLQKSGKNTHLQMFAYLLGFKPIVIKYHRNKRQGGRSRWTFRKKFNLLINVVLSFSRIFVRSITLTGFCIAVLGFMYGLFILASNVFFGIQQKGFTTLVILIIFFSGLIILMLGVVAEYVWRIHEQVVCFPQTVIEETRE